MLLNISFSSLVFIYSFSFSIVIFISLLYNALNLITNDVDLIVSYDGKLIGILNSLNVFLIINSYSLFTLASFILLIFIPLFINLVILEHTNAISSSGLFALYNSFILSLSESL